MTYIHVEDVLEVYAIRSVLGPLALRQLMSSPEARAERSCPQLKEYIRRAKSKEARADQRVLVDADSAFQTAIARASGLRRIADVFADTSAEAKFFVSALRVRYQNTDLIIEELEQLARSDRGGRPGHGRARLAGALQPGGARVRRGDRVRSAALRRAGPHLFQVVQSPGRFFERGPDAAAAGQTPEPR